MYLENQTEMEMSPASAQGHQGRSFGDLRLLQGISERRDAQKPSGCVIHAEGFVPVRPDDGYEAFSSLLLLLLLFTSVVGGKAARLDPNFWS